MKIYLTLIALAVFLTFIAGYVFFTEIQSPQSYELNETIVDQLVKQFVDETPNYEDGPIVFDFLTLFPPSGFPELVDPISLLPQTYRYSLNDLKLLNEYKKDCKKKPEPPSDPALHKAWLWQNYNCDGLKKLPSRFWVQPPYIDIEGRSYAWLRFQKNFKNKDLDLDKEEVRFFVYYSHVKEYQDYISEGLDIGKRAVFAELTEDALNLLVKNQSPILSKKNILITTALDDSLNQNDFYPADKNIYNAYDRDLWDEFIKKQGNHLKVTMIEGDSVCTVQQGNLCWSVSLGNFYDFFRKYVVVFFVVSLILVFLMIFLILRRVKLDKLQDERKKFALQTLTHELRTPVTSLKLALEHLRQDFDRIPEDLLENYVQINSEINRLQYLTEMSRQYLSLKDYKGLIQLNQKEIPSLNNYFSRILEPYEQRIQIELLNSDTAFKMDGYWLEIVIKNLIENALKHGEKPVEFSCSRQDRVLVVTVKDAGECHFESLNQMTEEFAKANVSDGLGLGLNLVHKIVLSMGGEFIYDKSPTRFTIKIKDFT